MRRAFHSPGATAAQITVPDQDDSQVREIDYVRWASQMQADLAQSLGGIMLRGARPVPIGSAAAGSNRPLSSPGRIVGWSLHETSGTNPALVRLFDGRDTTGSLLASVQVAASPAAASCNNTWFGTSGISVTDALYVDVSGAGTIEGTLYLGGVD
jgi:hypothetical protein